MELENLDFSNVKRGFSEFLSNNDIQTKMNAQFWSSDSKNIVGSVGRRYTCTCIGT